MEFKCHFLDSSPPGRSVFLRYGGVEAGQGRRPCLMPSPVQ